ncbi:single-stranded DNA-binding protein [Guggenheimella bovis]
MNQVILIGRLTRDPELRYTPANQRAVATFSLAVDRPFSRDNKTDFFRVTVWGAQAENVSKYLRKGSQCAVHGRIENNSYQDKDGNTRYTTDIVADSVEFLSRPSGSNEESSYPQEPEDSFPMVNDDDIPF